MVQMINPLQAVNEGQQFVDGIFTQRAQRQAGRALQGGNYNQAADALFGNGDVRGGLALQQVGQEQVAQQEAQSRARQAEQLKTTLQIVGTVKRARDSGQDVSQVLPQYRDAFIAMGTDPQQLMQIEQQIAANPAFLDQIEQIVGQQARELEIVNLGGGTAVAVDTATGQEVNRFEGARQPINVGGVLVDPITYQPILDTREPKYQTIQNTDGSTSVVAIDQPAPIRGAGGSDGSFESVIGPLLQREGGFVAQDGRSGTPANFGINQRANPDIDVRNLTPERATQLYRERYWEPVVQAGVPAEAREAVFDFAVNAGPRRAIEAWRRSGGDINAFNQERLAHYRRQPDYARNGRSWERRVAETTPAYVNTAGGARVVAQGENRGLTPAQQRAEEREAQREQQGARRDEVNLRREFNNRQEVKDYRTVEAAYNSVQAAARNPSAAGDLSLIFAYMKILDPGSVVREQEFANAQNAAGVPDRIRNLYNRALNGQRLNPSQRNDFLSQARNLYQSRRQNYDQIANEYRSYAQDYGVSPDRVAPINTPSSGTQPRTNAPGLRFNITEAQLQTRRQIVSQGGRPSEPLGSRRNPRYLNPSDPRSSYSNVRSGDFYVAPDGQIRQKR